METSVELWSGTRQVGEAVLTDDRPESSYGQAVVVIDGVAHGSADLAGRGVTAITGPVNSVTGPGQLAEQDARWQAKQINRLNDDIRRAHGTVYSDGQWINPNL